MNILRLEAADKFKIVKHLTRLSSEDRYLRFFNETSDSGIIKYVDNLDMTKDVVYGIFEKSEIVALVHLAINDDNSAEVAFSVDESSRNKGLAKSLLKEVKNFCLLHSIRNLEMVCLANNKPIRKIAEDLGMIVVTEFGEAKGQVELPANWNEIVAAGFEHMHTSQIRFIDKAVKSYLTLMGVQIPVLD